MKVAILGTQGVPARYGGFETLVENIIGNNASPDVEYTVFCSCKDLKTDYKVYKGAQLRYIPFNANGKQSVLYDILSLMKSMWGYDVILVLGVSGGIFFPVFRLFCRKKLIINVDGLEWKRPKWGRFARLFLRLSEELALRFSDIVVADNQGIVDYISKRYKKDSLLIAYGSDHVKREMPEDRHQEILEAFHLEQKTYFLSICRIEPENNCELILDVFAHTGKRLVFIGNWERCEFGHALKEEYSRYKNISIIDSIYDLDVLFVLRQNCKTYIHGHSAGGTNPSLIEAMFCECTILAYDVIYNRETTENKAHYFRDGIDLALLTSGDGEVADNAKKMYEIAERRYTWATIARQYEMFYGC